MDKKKIHIISASPKVRKFAREIGANLQLIKGTQRAGRIDEEDVKIFVKNYLSGKVSKQKQKLNQKV